VNRSEAHVDKGSSKTISITLKVLNGGMLHPVLFFWTESIIQCTKMKPVFQGLALPHLHVIKSILLGPLEGDNHSLWPGIECKNVLGRVHVAETCLV
jgi:hypothetical protein